ncbi:MAG: LamG-like jellyroll fold domain-containing protein [Vampirovibrionia bacterium]|jgi:hypothetical protein
MKLITILFIILVLVIFYYIYVGATKSGPITSLTDAKVLQTIDTAKLANNSGTNNYTYAIWMYVDNWNYRYGEPKVIFGRTDKSAQGESNPSPSVVLGAMQNDLTISIATYPTSTGGAPVLHNCVIKNVPLQKWTCVLVSLYGRSLDVYLDGKLVRTCVLPGVAKVNKNAPVKITPDGGFDGYTAKFMYFDKPTNPQEAWNIYKDGFASGGMLGNLFDKYKIKVAFLEDNVEQGSLEI